VPAELGPPFERKTVSCEGKYMRILSFHSSAVVAVMRRRGSVGSFAGRDLEVRRVSSVRPESPVIVSELGVCW
jgi:hypothetical protein